MSVQSPSTNLGPPMVGVHALSYAYGRRLALDRLSLEVKAGEWFALLGPNGSGKSTLLRILSSLRRPGEGSAQVDGWDVANQAAAVRHKLGVAFQAASLDKKLSVRENIYFQGFLYGLSGRRLSARVDEMLARFGLEERQGERAEKLSGGLRRRVELAKALLHRPPLLLLDEPSSGLDPAARIDFWEVLARMRAEESLTVLVATHLMNEAERCDRVGLLHQGRLVALDSPQRLKDNLNHETVILESTIPRQLEEKLRGHFKVKARVEGNTVRLEGKDGMGLARQAMTAFPLLVRAVRVSKPSLEDVFLTLTGRNLQGGEEHS